MKKNDECKIVRDLFPVFLDNLTDESTNHFIENHLSTCSECKEILKDMGNDIVLDKINEKEEINYLKKIKLKQRVKLSFISIALLIFAVVSVIFSVFIATCDLEIYGDDGKIDYMETFKAWLGFNKYVETFPNTEVSNILITWVDETHPNKIQTSKIYTFNASNNICIGCKVCVTGYTLDELNSQFIMFKNLEEEFGKYCPFRDVEIKDNKLVYSHNYCIGEVKEDVLNDISKGKYEQLIQF